MVLCKFFQQGSCRFGSKCNNEHFDAKQVIKTDIESAVNGKQWPLSTYGPFKDKPSIPNFIEDQSFEEIRLLCYEAKQKNFFDQFHQQFSKEAMEASNKMKALLQMTPEIIDVVINVYDTPSDTTCNGVAVAGKPNATNNNPFGVGNAAVNTAGSIFAKPAATQPATNIFGASTIGANNFGTTNAAAGSIFGGATASQPSSNIFGNSSAFGLQQQHPQQSQHQPQSSIFGQTAKPTNSIFGGGNTNTQQQTSMFGQQPQQQPAPGMGGNLFAQPAQQQQTSQGFGGIFSQQPQQQPQQLQQQQSSMFEQQQPQQQSTNMFGQTQLPQTANPFGQIAQPTPQQGLFAQAAQTMQQQQQPQPPQQGLFAQASQQTMPQPTAVGQGLFAQANQQTQNIFSQAMQQQQPPQQNPANIFQQNPVQQQQQLQNQPPPPSGLFPQNSLQNQNPAANTNPSTQHSTTLYSRMEDLTQEEIEAFKADCFLPGKIPFNPPPRELIN